MASEMPVTSSISGGMGWPGATRLSQRDLAVLDAQDGDLGDAVAHRMRAGALDIDEGETTRQAHAGLPRCRRRDFNGCRRRCKNGRAGSGAVRRISC